MIKIYGKKLQQLRKLEGWTQEEVAQKLGITKQTYSHYENENRKPGLDMILKLASVYSVNIDDIFRDDFNSGKEKASAYSVPVIMDKKQLPFYGEISAGALEYVDGVTTKDIEYVEIPCVMLGKYEDNDLFVMKVNGESMNLVIPNGSYVVCKKISYNELRDDDIVIYSHDGDYSMKRFRWDEEDRVSVFSPESSNKKFRDNVIPYDTQNDLKIYAKVVWYGVVLN